MEQIFLKIKLYRQKKLSDKFGMNIQYQTIAAEDIEFSSNTFDVVTACQCFWYFNHEKIIPKLSHILKAKWTAIIVIYGMAAI